MERSASTLTWQMTKRIMGVSPQKTHVYVEGDHKVLYTYRHPIEAYHSLTRCFSEIYPVSIAIAYAITRLWDQQETYKRLLEDQKQGRCVLFLKYEDYYYSPRKRLIELIKFIESDVSSSGIEKILEETSVQENMWASEGKGNFGDHDAMTGLHGRHIDPVHRGIPGSLLKHCGNSVDSKIIQLCEVFGYNVTSM